MKAYCDNIGRIPNDKDIDEALHHVKTLCQYAYDEGFHELGYDPVEVLRAALDNEV